MIIIIIVATFWVLGTILANFLALKRAIFHDLASTICLGLTTTTAAAATTTTTTTTTTTNTTTTSTSATTNNINNNNKNNYSNKMITSSNIYIYSIKMQEQINVGRERKIV